MCSVECEYLLMEDLLIATWNHPLSSKYVPCYRESHWQISLGTNLDSHFHTISLVGLFIVPSIYLITALNWSSFWCNEQPIVCIFCSSFFRVVLRPDLHPVFVLVLSRRIALNSFNTWNRNTTKHTSNSVSKISSTFSFHSFRKC